MPHTMLTVSQAARHICIPEKQLRHLALQNEIPCIKKGDQFFFEHRQLDDWAQQRIMRLSPNHLKQHHLRVAAEHNRNISDDHMLEKLLTVDRIHPELKSKTKPGLIRDMVKAASDTGLLNDEEYLHRELLAREEIGSTAIGDGAALLHNRYFDKYTFEESFIVLGRTVKPLFFGCQNGGPTDIFFLICCIDDELHLHVLARICMLIHGTELMPSLRAAETAEDMFNTLRSAEQELLREL
ncbi:MAG: PTS sugar transporter subunit IIA [Kiritimatiellia bacterium]